MKKTRFEHIDFLRAVAIIVVIATHVLSYHLTNPLNYFIWNYLHFAVVAFVFCSGYVLTARYQNAFTTFSETLRWYKKRLTRLLLPFYTYLFIHYGLIFAFPKYFSGLGLQKSFNFLTKSVLFTGGVNLNWLPLLFVQLTLLFPFLIQIAKKKAILFSYIIFSFVVTIFFSVKTFPYNYYRLVMWIPWSLILLFSIFAFNREQRNAGVGKYLFSLIISALLFISLSLLWQMTHKSLQLVDYKYPPSLYYLSYACGLTSLFLIISRMNFLKIKPVNTFFKFISENSYQLFFIHYIILDLTQKTLKGLLSTWFIQFIIVLLISLSICYIIKTTYSVFKNRQIIHD